MFDEADVSCNSQHSVYSRYVNRGNIFEDFVGFTDLRGGGETDKTREQQKSWTCYN